MTNTDITAALEILNRVVFSADSAAIRIGSVVRFSGRRARRRYVVVAIDRFGAVSLVALSGGFRGSAPSGHAGTELEVLDAPVEFSGKIAGSLVARAASSVRVNAIDLETRRARAAFYRAASPLVCGQS